MNKGLICDSNQTLRTSLVHIGPVRYPVQRVTSRCIRPLVRTRPSSSPTQVRRVCESAAPSRKPLSASSARVLSPLSLGPMPSPPPRRRPLSRRPARSAEKEERVKIKRPPRPSLICTVRRRDEKDLTRKLCLYRRLKVLMKRPVLHNLPFQ